jgi:LysR family transcriptional regulator, hca operon transcriptional activator
MPAKLDRARPVGSGLGIELRHLRYLIAAAESGSLTEAAERRLHTSQPSLSRRIRDLADHVGAKLLQRRLRGIAAQSTPVTLSCRGAR